MDSSSAEELVGNDHLGGRFLFGVFFDLAWITEMSARREIAENVNFEFTKVYLFTKESCYKDSAYGQTDGKNFLFRPMGLCDTVHYFRDLIRQKQKSS